MRGGPLCVALAAALAFLLSSPVPTIRASASEGNAAGDDATRADRPADPPIDLPVDPPADPPMDKWGEGPVDMPIDVEVSGHVAAPLAVVRGVLLDLERLGEWFPATGEWRVLARPRPGAARVYGRQALPWPVSDRDYVVDYTWTWQDEAGVFVLRAEARAGAAPPPPDGVVRVERMRTEWRVEAAPGGTAVRYRYMGDTGGRLPGWVARAGWRSRTPLVVDALRARVEAEMARARRGPDGAGEAGVAEGAGARPRDEGSQ